MQKPPIVIDGPFKERDKYPLYHSLRGDPRVLGLEGQLNPVIHFNSTPRSNMASSQIVQATIVDGAEMPQMASGFEQKFIEYTFNTSRMPQAGTSRYVIPKYRANTGSNPIRSTPSYTLIYIGQEDQQLHYVNVPTYVKGQDGFGYLTEINFKKLMSNVGLEKGECIAHSHAVQGEQYCLGTNLSTCYLTAKETVEDAVWLSESGARKLGTTGIKKVTINWGCNDVALNLYGDELTYKFMPDIGDRIRDDGIIAALRRVDDNSIIADMNDTALTTVQDIHDTVYYGVTSEATVIDIDVWINESKKVKTPEHIFTQLNKYVEENKYYYKRILEIFQLECVQNRIQPSVEFGTLVERAASFMSIYTRNSPVLGMTKRSVPKLSRKSEPIPFIQIDIHYAFKYVVNVGYKITNRDASKGVISRISPDEDMPVDDHGNRAEVVIAPGSTINRMNMGQLYTQFVNALAGNMLRHIRGYTDVNKAFSDVLELFDDINPDYASLTDRTIVTTAEKKEFLDISIKTDRLVMVTPPFLATLSPEWCVYMADKYNIQATPVEYNLRDDDGNFIRRVRTVEPVFIAKQYFYLLCKMPHVSACAASYVNQYGIPIRVRDKRVRNTSTIGITPFRLGEDEVRNLCMTVGEAITSRILSLYANSPEGLDKLITTLLTAKKPFNIEQVDITDAELRNSNQTIKIFNHLMKTAGVDSEHTTATPEELNELNAIEGNYKW